MKTILSARSAIFLELHTFILPRNWNTFNDLSFIDEKAQDIFIEDNDNDRPVLHSAEGALEGRVHLCFRPR
jgi:hypothetical protein